MGGDGGGFDIDVGGPKLAEEVKKCAVMTVNVQNAKILIVFLLNYLEWQPPIR